MEAPLSPFRKQWKNRLPYIPAIIAAKPRGGREAQWCVPSISIVSCTVHFAHAEAK